MPDYVMSAGIERRLDFKPFHRCVGLVATSLRIFSPSKRMRRYISLAMLRLAFRSLSTGWDCALGCALRLGLPLQVQALQTLAEACPGVKATLLARLLLPKDLCPTSIS